MGDPQNPISLKDCDVCPGYLVRCQAVAEAHEAGAALDKNSLEIYYPNSENVILEAAMLYTHSWTSYEAYLMRKANQKK